MISRLKCLVVATAMLSGAMSFSATLQRVEECSAKIQGGVDVFPWSVARPFPWNDIQGVWEVKGNSSDVQIYMKARVSSTIGNKKILNISIIEEGNCGQPLAKGTGFIDYNDPNVVRSMVNDGTYRYQLRMALFNSKDLSIDSMACGDHVLAASIQILGQSSSCDESNSSRFFDLDGDNSAIQNIMLKKSSKDMSDICKRPVSF